MTDLPEATISPCNDCPWRREATRGWLGPFSAEEWIAIVHSDAPVACHQTLNGQKGWDAPGVKQCRGAAIFRENVCKSPRDPSVVTGPLDKESVFAWNDEFLAHHDSPLASWLAEQRDEAEPSVCDLCGEDLSDWSTPGDYVPAQDGVCGRCRAERESPKELGS